MKILILGKNGQVGWELQRSLAPLGCLISLGRNSSDNPDTLCGDLLDLQGLKQTIHKVKPDIIVNAAAYTAVDKAESEYEISDIINCKAPALLAQEALKLDALLVHYSTDYVFDGTKKGFWTERDKPNPLNQYGKSKLAGEIAIRSNNCKHLIFRTSWVYGVLGNNFAKTILKLAKEKTSLSVISDQHGIPTGADIIADCTAHAIIQTLKDPEKQGLYHLVSGGETTWFDYANFIINQAEKLDIDMMIKRLTPVTTSEYKTAAMRPLNSKLDSSKVTNTFGFNLPDWQDGVGRLLVEINS